MDVCNTMVKHIRVALDDEQFLEALKFKEEKGWTWEKVLLNGAEIQTPEKEEVSE